MVFPGSALNRSSRTVRADMRSSRNTRKSKVRRALLGDADARLHAVEFGRSPPGPEKFEILDRFFRQPQFCRFAVAATRETRCRG